MNRIVPAILADNKNDLLHMIKVCASFTDYVQIDIMDGVFVPSTSVMPQDVGCIKTNVKSEAHLMVKEPLAWVDSFYRIGAKRIIYHYESTLEHLSVINCIKDKGLEAGLAVNPATGIDEFRFLIDKVDTFLFMSVNPGFYGAAFIPDVLQKIRRFKQEYKSKIAGIDGGIKLSNLREVAKSGVDYICVGSAILKEAGPAAAYQEFVKILQSC